MGRRRSRRGKSPTTSDIEFSYKIPGLQKLLFETPTGFAIFSIDVLYLEKDIEDIWTYFASEYWCKNVVWLHEFQKFEDKLNVINLTTKKLDVGLIKMLWKHCKHDDKLVVGRPEYKEIIEGSLGITCMYSDAAREVMWGLQNLMHSAVAQEQSEITMEDRFPMSKGLDMVLRRHNFDVKPEMINEPILRMANAVYNIDLSERMHSKYLHNLLDEEFMAISGVDILDWSLLKLATAVKKMCYPYEGILLGDPYEMFSLKDLEIIVYDAAEYREKVDKSYILEIYEDVVSLHENKIDARYELKCLVKEAKGALEAEEVQQKPATNGVDSKRTQVASTKDPSSAESMDIIGGTEQGKNASVNHMNATPNASNFEEEKQLTSNAERRNQTEGSAAANSVRMRILPAEEMLPGETMEIHSGECKEEKTSTKELSDDASSSVKPAGSPEASLDDHCNLPGNDIGEISNKRPQRWKLFSCFRCAQ